MRRASRSGRTVHSRLESAWRDSRRFALAQLLDHGQHFLFGEDAFAFQQLYQCRVLPHAGDGEFFEGDKAFRVEFYSRALTRRVRTVG